MSGINERESEGGDILHCHLNERQEDVWEARVRQTAASKLNRFEQEPLILRTRSGGGRLFRRQPIWLPLTLSDKMFLFSVSVRKREGLKKVKGGRPSVRQGTSQPWPGWTSHSKEAKRRLERGGAAAAAAAST